MHFIRSLASIAFQYITICDSSCASTFQKLLLMPLVYIPNGSATDKHKTIALRHHDNGVIEIVDTDDEDEVMSGTPSFQATPTPLRAFGVSGQTQCFPHAH
jgi:hypothetical protein